MIACVSMREGCLILKIIDHEGAARLTQDRRENVLVVGQYVIALERDWVAPDCFFSGPLPYNAPLRSSLPITLHNTTLCPADHIDVSPKDHLRLVRLQRDIIATLLYASRKTDGALRLSASETAVPGFRRTKEHMLALSDSEFIGYCERRL